MMALFIDLDGTLLDISEKYYQLYQKALQDHDTALLKYQFWEMKRAKLSDEEIFAATQAVVDIEKYNAMKPKLLETNLFLSFDTLQTNVQSTLAYLKNRYKMYLVTLRKNKENLYLQLKQLQIEHFFDKIFSPNDDMASLKGYEQKIKLIQQYLEPDGTNIIIGDSEADVYCGKFLNLETIGLISGITNFSIMKELSPKYIVRDFSQIPKIIQI